MISGQIDLAIVGPTEAEPARDLGLGVTKRANRWFGLTILDRAGELVPEMGDPRVRQALGFAVDRQAIADSVYFGYARPTSQPMASWNLGHDAELESFLFLRSRPRPRPARRGGQSTPSRSPSP